MHFKPNAKIHCSSTEEKGKEKKMENTMISHFSRVNNEMISSPFFLQKNNRSRKNWEGGGGGGGGGGGWWEHYS